MEPQPVPQGTNSYEVTLSIAGPLSTADSDVTVTVHPHPLVDPEGGDGESKIWWWDVAGMAIVKAGEPWTTVTGVHDFHEVPGDSTFLDWDGEGDPMDWVQANGTVNEAVLLIGGVTVAITRSEHASPGGTDGV